jgi:hypothetical protein
MGAGSSGLWIRGQQSAAVQGVSADQAELPSVVFRGHGEEPHIFLPSSTPKPARQRTRPTARIRGTMAAGSASRSDERDPLEPAIAASHQFQLHAPGPGR